MLSWYSFMFLSYEISKIETIRYKTQLKYYYSLFSIVLYLCINVGSKYR